MNTEQYLDQEQLQDLLTSKKRSLHSILRNLRIVDEEIANVGNSNVDLRFRLQSLEDDKHKLENQIKDLEARLHSWDEKRGIQVITDLLYSYLPSGILHLYDAQTKPLIRFAIFNESSHDLEFIVSSNIEGFSYSRTDTLAVPRGQRKIISQLPQIDIESAKRITEIRRAVLHTKIHYLDNGQKLLFQEQDFDIYFTARNVIQWAIVGSSTDEFMPLLDHVAAWVTPRAQPVKQTLRTAADKLGMLWGYQGKPDASQARIQVKSIYESLKDEVHLAYINSPFGIGPSGGKNLQSIRLPRESIEERSANCIDGAVLYASLLEWAALEPIIVILRGHAFVGWKIWQNSAEYEFLETTMTLSAPFEDALHKGNEQYMAALNKGWFNAPVFDPHGFAQLLDIKKLHDNGCHPME